MRKEIYIKYLEPIKFIFSSKFVGKLSSINVTVISINKCEKDFFSSKF